MMSTIIVGGGATFVQYVGVGKGKVIMRRQFVKFRTKDLQVLASYCKFTQEST